MSGSRRAVVWLSIATAFLFAVVVISLLRGSSVVVPVVGFVLVLAATVVTAWRGARG